MSRPTEQSEQAEPTGVATTGPTTASNAHSGSGQATQQPLPQPYQQQPSYVPHSYAPQAIPSVQPVRVLPPYSKPWTISKLILTVLSLCWAAIILALSLATSINSGHVATFGLILLAVPISVVSILWNLAELTTYVVRSQKNKEARRGIHPGAHLGMHLVFWLVSLLSIFAMLLTLGSAVDYIEYCAEGDDEDDYRGSSYISRYCEYYSSGAALPSLRALLTMWCLALINHFVLFVLACIDTHQRNSLKPAGIVFAQPGTVPMGYYPPPPPQQNHQNLAGFYAPQAPPGPVQDPSAAAPAPVSPRQPTAQPGSNGDEVTPAPPRI